MLDSDPTAGTAAAHVNLAMTDGVHQVTTHLLGHGHRRFLHLAADIETWTFDVRARALAARLGPTTELRTVRAALTVDAARTAMEAALAGPHDRPTAIVCDDDILAAGACKAARRLGLRVPEDLSVTGFDDLGLATAVEPELTTVRLPAELVGEQGMTALLAVLEGTPGPPPTSPSNSSSATPRAPPPPLNAQGPRPAGNGGPGPHAHARPTRRRPPAPRRSTRHPPGRPPERPPPAAATAAGRGSA